MNQNEKEHALKFQPVYPSDCSAFTGLTFYQSLILSLSQNPEIVDHRLMDQSALGIASHINDVAKRIIQVMSQNEGI